MIEAEVKFRSASAKDIDSIIALQMQLDRPSPSNRIELRKFHDLVKLYIHSTGGRRGIVLATSNSMIIGMVSYIIIDRLNQKRAEFWIPELVVACNYRNMGVGKRLIQKCESIAKRKKCYRIRLESRNDRLDSHEFYKKVGFTQIVLTFEMTLV